MASTAVMIAPDDIATLRSCPSPFNLAAHVLAAGETCPEKEALLVVGADEARRWSHAELRRAVLGTATGLLSEGLKPGDKVLLRLGNTVDFPLAYLGALAAGLVPVPTAAALTRRETETILDLLRPAAVLHAPGIDCAPHPGRLSLTQLQQMRGLPPAEFHMGSADRPGYIVFTSGTSGRPRAVLHAHRAIWARQMMFHDWYGLGSDDRVLHAGAFNWTYTLGTGLMDPWTVGATAIIPASGVAPGQLPGLIRKHKATIFAAAPGVYRQMLDQAQDMRLPELRHGLSAGEKLPRRTAERWHAATGLSIFEAYGMSECSTFISQPAGKRGDPGTLGRPQRGRQITLRRESRPVPVGEEGTIAVAADDPGLMLGYLDADGRLDRALSDGWFETGDQGIITQDGTVRYLGRRDDMMNAGGFRVSPIEVETVLSELPGVTAVAVTDVEIKADTRVIAAFYTGPAALDETSLHAYVSDKLARYKQPRLYIHLDALPQGANGKILRSALRDQFESQHD